MTSVSTRQDTQVDGWPPARPLHHHDREEHARRRGVGRRARTVLATTASALALSLTLSLVGGLGVAHAAKAAGTASPPKITPPPAPVQVTPPPPPAVPPPVFSGPVNSIHQFAITGFIQAVTVSNARCPGVPQPLWGGTVQVNGLTVVIPCHLILQMPAFALTWADAFAPATPPRPPLTLQNGGFPSFEITVVGNIVNGEHLAGLVLVSQQSVMAGQGLITGFDYAHGVMFVGSAAGGPPQVRVQINDPRGRFSVGQTPDARFTVDDENPTIHAATGYPMCIPRHDPQVQNDPECPQKNRPRVNLLAPFSGCRTFAAAGVVLPSGRELAPPAAGQTVCSAFVMEDPTSAAVRAATSTQPNATKQAPFEVGDYITYAGTLIKDGLGPHASNTIAAHTIEASVGIFTQPHTLPAYLSIGNFTIAADAPATAINGAAQETQNRLILEASVTDVTSVVDIYLIDFDPVTGAESNRWVTPEAMTGEANGVFVGDTNPATQFHGGITTQFNGPIPGRARLRATKAPVGLLVSPTRTLRVAVRTLCTPANVNDLVGGVPCLERMPAAKGTANPAVAPLFTGQYLAPVFSYIFPENVVAGDPIVPNNLWDLGFLMNGEGPGTGPLMPTPW